MVVMMSGSIVTGVLRILYIDMLSQRRERASFFPFVLLVWCQYQSIPRVFIRSVDHLKSSVSWGLSFNLWECDTISLSDIQPRKKAFVWSRSYVVSKEKTIV